MTDRLKGGGGRLLEIVMSIVTVMINFFFMYSLYVDKYGNMYANTRENVPRTQFSIYTSETNENLVFF